MHLFVLVAAWATVVGPAAVQVPAAAGMPQTLANVAKTRETQCASWTMITAAKLNEPMYAQWASLAELEPEARRFAIPFSYLKPNGLNVAPYRKALVAALRNPDPKIRGLACEVASECWDLELLAPLGALLDDNAAAGPVRLGLMMQQQPSPRGTPVPPPTGCRPPVKYMAKSALGQLAGIRFGSKADFNVWLANNRRPETKRWYWQAKWRHRWDFSLGQLVERDERIATYKAAQAKSGLDASFAKLDRRSQLSVLSTCYVFDQMMSGGPLSLELARDLGGTVRLSGISFPRVDEGTRPNDVGAYLKAHGFAKELLAFLTTAKVGNKPADEETLNMFRCAASAGWEVLQEKDEPALAKAQRRAGLPQGLKEDLALLRAKLAPAKAATILSDYLAIRADSTRCLGALARLGSAAGKPLVSYYWRGDDSARQSIAQGLSYAAEHKVRVTPEYILQLLELPASTARKVNGLTVLILARTAKSVVGRDVANPESLNELQSFFMKAPRRGGGLTVESASEKVRAELIEGLRPHSTLRAD